VPSGLRSRPVRRPRPDRRTRGARARRPRDAVSWAEQERLRLATRAVRKELVDAVLALPKVAWPEPGYVLDSLETDDHVTHDHVFCYEHAQIVQVGDQILTGCQMQLCDLSQGETDSVENCPFYG